MPSKQTKKGENMENKMKTGTTTVGLVGKDGVVLAADKRATMGYMIASKDVEKIHPIAPHIAMTVAGSVGDAQLLVRWMSVLTKDYELENEKRIPVKSAATLLSNILVSTKYLPYWVQLLMAGYDEKPRLFSIDMVGGVTEENEKSATGSGSPYAYGVIESRYKKGMGVKELLPIATKAVWAAMQRDVASGEGIDVVTITKKGVHKLSPDEVKKLL